MNIIAFNGSPRKSWNTATLLNKALEGATSAGAETELIHLYDLIIREERKDDTHGKETQQKTGNND